ncbi:MAG: hypothetical protein WAW63_00175 [Candidatus Saccharimonadales bacterium]
MVSTRNTTPPKGKAIVDTEGSAPRGYNDSHVSPDATAMFVPNAKHGHYASPADWRRAHGRLPLRFILRKMFVAPVLMAANRSFRGDKAYNEKLANQRVEISTSPRLMNLLWGVKDGRYTGYRSGLTHERRRTTALAAAAAILVTGLTTARDGHLPFTDTGNAAAAVASMEAGGTTLDGVIGGAGGSGAKKEALPTTFSLPAGKISCSSVISMVVEKNDVAAGASPLLARMSSVAGEGFSQLPQDSQAGFLTQVLSSPKLNPGSHATALADPNSLPGKTVLVPTNCTGAGL